MAAQAGSRNKRSIGVRSGRALRQLLWVSFQFRPAQPSCRSASADLRAPAILRKRSERLPCDCSLPNPNDERINLRLPQLAARVFELLQVRDRADAHAV